MQPTETPRTSPFRITRASHLELTVRDLSRSREFYTEVLGLAVSHEDRTRLYLRGVEERSHHSLILTRTEDAPSCVRTGLRVFDEEDLDKAKSFFEQKGMAAEFVEAPFQGRTLRTTDIVGAPLEFCASMGRLERVDQKFEDLRGA